MRTTRRDFVRWLGLGVAGAIGAPRTAAGADRIRVLGGPGDAERPGPMAGRISPELRRFVRAVAAGAVSAYGAIRVVWLHGTPGAPLPVATLEEARARGDLLIAERDQAAVPEVVVENRGKVAVLLLAGEILLGGKQNRVLVEDLLLPPGSGPRGVGVYCVEQGRWAGRSPGFDARGSFAAPGLRAKVLERADQGRIWDEVGRYARNAAAPSPTHSYQAIYEKPEVKVHLDAAERGLDRPATPGALGAAVFIGEGLAGLDLFFDPGLFAREWPKLLRAQALDGYGRDASPGGSDGVFRSRAEALLRATAEGEGSLRANAGAGRLFECRVGSHRGVALLFEGRIVHAAVL
ncbi:MAG TPA: DUF6569 family protein [Methylomirabilota bacterium]|nr:DUF6569 family protein [Methylomirabilota bacterium]